MPATGRHAVELMGCDFGSKKCPAINWFTFLGNVNSEENIPFQINYIPKPSTDKTENNKIPLNPPVIPCSQTITVSIFSIHKILNLKNIILG